MASTNSSPAPDGDDSSLQTTGKVGGSKVDVPQDSKTVFPLLKLPPELWSKIGTDVLDAELKYFEIRTTMPRYNTGQSQPSITRICSVMRAELLPYFYRNCFAVTLNMRDMSHHTYFDLGHWLQAIGPVNRRQLSGSVVVLFPKGLLSGVRKTLMQDWKVELELVEVVTEVHDDEKNGRYRVMFT